jgi:hypothetical protein
MGKSKEEERRGDQLARLRRNKNLGSLPEKTQVDRLSHFVKLVVQSLGLIHCSCLVHGMATIHSLTSSLTSFTHN